MLMNSFQHHQSHRKPAVLVVLLITGVLLSGQASRTVHAYWSDLEIVSIENYNSSGTIVFDLDVKRLTRMEFGIAGTVTVAADYQSTTTDIVIYFSAKANNQYVLLPLKFGAKPTCEQVNGLYVKYVMKDLADVSDLPQVDEPGQEVCDLMTDKAFTIRKYVFDASVLPKLIQSGMYKVQVRVWQDEEVVVAGMEIVVKLS